MLPSKLPVDTKARGAAHNLAPNSTSIPVTSKLWVRVQTPAYPAQAPSPARSAASRPAGPKARGPATATMGHCHPPKPRLHVLPLQRGPAAASRMQRISACRGTAGSRTWPAARYPTAQPLRHRRRTPAPPPSSRAGESGRAPPCRRWPWCRESSSRQPGV